jgi:hypothetical protein
MISPPFSLPCGTTNSDQRQRTNHSAGRHHHIGLEETDDGLWSIFFNTVLIAKLDERDYIIHG